MMKNNTRIKRLLASIMTGAIILSAASAMSVTAASAVTTQSICLQAEQNSEVTDGLFTAAETLMGVVTTANPAAGIIGSGLLGAFKSFYCDSMNYLNLWDTTITDNEAKNAGGRLYAQKGSASSCDPEIKGKITITDNKLLNGTASNAFLGENTTSKCIFTISEKIDPSSRIGITSPTSDKTLDVVKIANKTAYDNTKNVFSYDTGAYRINRYKGTFTSCYWVEIKKN